MPKIALTQPFPARMPWLTIKLVHLTCTKFVSWADSIAFPICVTCPYLTHTLYLATLKARDVVSQNGGYDWNPHIPLIFTENFYLMKTKTKSERSEEKLDITGKIRYSNSNVL